MTRNDINFRVILLGIIVIILVTALDSCSKDEQIPEKRTFLIDLTDPKYVALTLYNGYMIILSEGLIVDNSFDSGYNAADSWCPNCSSNIDYVKAGVAHWTCPNCKTFFYVTGQIMSGPATNALKVYPVNKEGNILTIHLN